MSMPEVGELVTMLELRDYFAAKAMQGTLCSPHARIGGFDEIAKTAYQIADAMLEARK